MALGTLLTGLTLDWSDIVVLLLLRILGILVIVVFIHGTFVLFVKFGVFIFDNLLDSWS